MSTGIFVYKLVIRVFSAVAALSSVHALLDQKDAGTAISCIIIASILWTLSEVFD